MTHPEILKRLLRLTRPYRIYWILSLVLAVIGVGLSLYSPVLIGRGIDLIVAKGQVDFQALKPILSELGIVVLVASVSQWLMGLCTNKLTYLSVSDLRRQVFGKIQKVPLKYIDSHPHGDILSRIIIDIDQVSEGLLMGFTQLFTGLITILGTLGFMLAVNVKITAVVVFVTPLSLFAAHFIAKRTFSMFRLQSEIRGEMTALVTEFIGNQKTVTAFGHEKEALEKFKEINSRLQTCGTEAVFFSSVTNPVTRFVNGVVYAGVGITGALAAVGGLITVGQLSCFLAYANQYTKPFNEISGVIAELQSALASAKRIFEIVDEKPETPDAPDALVLEKADGSVGIENVDFSYTPEQQLIKNLNLNVKPGQKIALVGPTGCGKTTVINLLMRFYDTDKGVIRVSDYPVNMLTRDSLRSLYGMVLQETWLKAGTVRENIAYGKPGASEEEVIKAAKSAYADNFIRRLPDGYDTVISEDGGNISQGQKQLLCIARVMLVLPPMLILDEATSSIDTRTEIHIQQAFSEMMKDRTSFIVAHRLSTIREADCILVMNEGQIVEQGTHQELLEKGKFYAELYNSQFILS